jgi:hypothetical protein
MMKNFFRILFFKIWFSFDKVGRPFWLKNKTWCLYWYKEEWVIVHKGLLFKDALYWGENLDLGLRLLDAWEKTCAAWDGWDYGGGVDDPRY